MAELLDFCRELGAFALGFILLDSGLRSHHPRKLNQCLLL